MYDLRGPGKQTKGRDLRCGLKVRYKSTLHGMGTVSAIVQS